MPSTKAFSTAIGVMLAFALDASAASISFTSAPGPITSLAVNNDVQYNGPFAFPAFDASLGTLSAVAVTYSISRIDGFLYHPQWIAGWGGPRLFYAVARRRLMKHRNLRLKPRLNETTTMNPRSQREADDDSPYPIGLMTTGVFIDWGGMLKRVMVLAAGSA